MASKALELVTLEASGKDLRAGDILAIGANQGARIVHAWVTDDGYTYADVQGIYYSLALGRGGIHTIQRAPEGT